MADEWDCIVIGGGAAGLSAALALGRARRRTLVVDAGRQSNLAAAGIGGLLGQEGRPPAELYRDGRAELDAFPTVEVRDGDVTTGVADDGGFTLELADGARVGARRILLAMGMDYRMPTTAGLAELWGRSAFHCPFCHGWEMRDRPLAVLASGERAVHMALMLRGWTDDVVVLTDGARLGEDEARKLTAAGVGTDERPVAQFNSTAGELTSIGFADGDELARTGVMVATSLHQRSTLAARLGVAFAPAGPVVVDPVLIDPMHRTSVPGVFAAGDVSAQMPQVAAAIATGSLGAAAIVASLLADDVGLLVPPWPQHEENADVHA